ncbi:hypothetical protein ACFL0B_07495 [Thermodesulfobacteriota bacterium]
MIEAEIKGKLPEVENKEDVLTSSTFGMLKYILDNTVLINILKYAKTINGKSFYDCIDVNLKDYQAEFVFWPTLSGYGEPDLLIVFRGMDGTELQLCIEVKYYSSKSGDGENDQLRRYFEGLDVSNTANNTTFLGIVYLTMYSSSKEMADSLDYIKSKGINDAEERLSQLRWFEVTKALEESDKSFLSKTEQSILSDVVGYLKHKNFVEFSGFSYQFEDFRENNESFYETDIGYEVVEGKKEFEGFSYMTRDFDLGEYQNFYGEYCEQ